MTETYRLFVRDLVLPGLLGVYQRERGRPQRVRVNLDLEVERGAGGDEIDAVVSYDDVIGGVHEVVAAGHVQLAETLAERIATRCLADRRVIEARVRVDKLEPFAEADSVGVEITRKRAD